MANKTYPCNAYSNAELAEHYVTVKGAEASADGMNIHRRVAGMIKAAPQSFVDFYKRHGSVRGMKMRGFGPGTKQTIDQLLRDGVEVAREVAWGVADAGLESEAWDGGLGSGSLSDVLAQTNYLPTTKHDNDWD